MLRVNVNNFIVNVYIFYLTQHKSGVIIYVNVNEQKRSFKMKTYNLSEIKNYFKEEEELEKYDSSKLKKILTILKKKRIIYYMLIPVFLYFYFFKYRPIGGILVAFKDYNGNSVSESHFVGFYHFRNLLFGNNYGTEFVRAFRNTFAISFFELIFGFPVPILLALFFSEIKSLWFRNITQVLTYLPKFISTVVVTSIIWLMLKPGSSMQAPGFLANIFYSLGLIEDASLDVLTNPSFFRPIYIISDIWSNAGYNSIVYFAAIMAISPTSYEAAKIDGASKLSQIRYVTLPGMAPTLTIMLILRIGHMLQIGYEKAFLLTLNKGSGVMETGEIISTFVIKIGGMLQATGTTSVPVAAAGDLFNSLIAMFLVVGSNFISRKVSNTSLF